MIIRPIKIFCCYAHEDDALRKQLADHLSPLRRLRDITGWFNRDILPGVEWERESKEQLDTADIILLLISANFMASDYCYTVEMTRALERHRAGTACVIPILLRPVAWEETPLSKLSPLPANRTPVTTWTNPDAAWLSIVQGISEIVRKKLPKQLLSLRDADILYTEQGPLSGQTIGEKYLLGELIGEGGFSQVYKAQHLQIQRQQAIKVLLECHLRKPKSRDRFLYEAHVVASLDHPHIIHLDDFGIEASQAYLVMPYMTGGTLENILEKQQGFLERNQIVFYLEHICAALDYAHKKGVVHLDLKPLNLLVHEDGRLVLSDFGLAHLMKQGAVEGGSSLRAGTPHYMAPEHIEGLPEKCSDLFSLGVILYQMLVGQQPFHEAIILKNMTAWPPAPRVLRPMLPQAVEAMLKKALEKQPQQRYQTANEFLVAFKRALEKDTPLLPQMKPIPDSLPDEAQPVTRPSSATSPMDQSQQNLAPLRENDSAHSLLEQPDTIELPMSKDAKQTKQLPTLAATDPETETVPSYSPIASTALIEAPLNFPAVLPTRSPSALLPTLRSNRAWLVAVIPIVVVPITVVLVIVTLLLYGSGAPTVLSNPTSQTTISIAPRQKLVNDRYLMQGVMSKANPANLQVTIRKITVRNSWTDTVKATGWHVIPAVSATGMLTFANSDTNPDDLPKGTEFLGVITDSSVTIPAGGRASVKAHASQAGAVGNISAGTINQLYSVNGGRNLSIKNNTFSGGVNATGYTYLQESDFENLVNPITDINPGNWIDDIQHQMEPGEQLLLGGNDININPEGPQPTADKPIGDTGIAVTTAKVTFTWSESARVFDANAAQTMAKKLLKQKANKALGVGYVLKGNIDTEAQPQIGLDGSITVRQDGSIALSVTASGLWSYQWTNTNKQALANQQVLLNMVKGKSVKDAENILNSYLGDNAAIDISNDGNTLPSDINRITLYV